MTSIRLLGVDTGFNHTGLVVVEWDGTTACIVGARTVNTEPTAKKRRMLVVDDHLRRIREILHGIEAVRFARFPKLVVLEAFSPARNAGNACRQAFGYASAVAVAEHALLPIAQFTPQEIHKRLGVPKPPPLPRPAAHHATKEEKRSANRARSAASAENKSAVWVTAAKLAPGPWDELTEHESDAACAALAALFPVPIDLVRMAMGASKED